MKKLKNKTLKRRKSRKSRTRARGRTPPVSPNVPVTCSMCDKSVPRNKTLVPALCLKEHGDRAHRICHNCWWNTFAKENAPHGCPGCIKGLPLPPTIKGTRKPTTEEIFVISDS
jgi:hypothetical protein